jgi:hypothetical protein
VQKYTFFEIKTYFITNISIVSIVCIVEPKPKSMYNYSIFFFSVALLVVAGTSCNLEPGIDVVRLCNNPDYDITCPDDQSEFDAVETDTIFLTAILNHVPEGTHVTVEWFYLENGKDKLSAMQMVTYEEATDYQVNSRLPEPKGGWKKGKHLVVMNLNTEGFKSIEKEFVIK